MRVATWLGEVVHVVVLETTGSWVGPLLDFAFPFDRNEPYANGAVREAAPRPMLLRLYVHAKQGGERGACDGQTDHWHTAKHAWRRASIPSCMVNVGTPLPNVE